MDKNNLDNFFGNIHNSLESEYTRHQEPWKQSGFSGPEERWKKCRKPISDCINENGSFLDIGCANGYLIECVLKWKMDEGLNIVPYGLDISEKLIEIAKYRVKKYVKNLFVGNVYYWKPHKKFNFVRAELIYLPNQYHIEFINRLLNFYVEKNGKLLLCEYRSSNQIYTDKWINEYLNLLGFKVEEYKSCIYDNKELTRVAILHNNT